MKNIFKKVIVSSFLLSLIFGLTGCTANTMQNDITNVKTTIQQQIPDIQYKSITKLNKISPTTKIAAKTILASMDKATTEMEEYLADNHKQEEKDSLYALYINNMYYYTELLKSNLSINAMYDYPRPEHTSFTANGLNFAYDNTQLYLAYNDFTHSLINMKYAGEGVYLPDFDIYYQAMMFSKYLSKNWQDYLSIRARESQYLSDVTFSMYGPGDYSNVNMYELGIWIKDWSDFLEKYPDFYLKDKISEDLNLYIKYYLNPSQWEFNETTPMDSTKQLEFEQLLKNLDTNTDAYKILNKAYTILQNNKFKTNLEYQKLYEKYERYSALPNQ